MLDSTARAERLDLSSSPVASYLWQVAQKPVAVRLPLELIDRLEHQTVEAFRSLTSRGSEIGGLLFGTVSTGSPTVVTLDDYELIACDYSRGPLYRLSDADMGRFEHVIEQRGGGFRVAGFFRSHTRKGLSLDAEDLAFFEPRFHDPHHMIMLVRPFATKASVAGIFIRENGRITSEASYQEFPFRSSELSPGRKSSERTESAPPVAPRMEAEPGIAGVAKHVVRAQIVPIASRREITLPEPVIAPVQHTPIAHPPAAEPAPEAKAAPEAKTAPKVEEKEAAKEVKVAREVKEVKEPVKEVKDKEAGKAKAAAAVVEAPKPEPAKVEPPKVENTRIPASLDIEPPAPAKNKKLRLIVAAALAMIVLVGGALFVYPSLRKPGRSNIPAKQDSSQLSLRVEHTSGGLLLTWNRDADAIKNATKVVLAISDGDRHENIELDPNQVRTGSILYPPISGDVSFQVEVTDAHQTKTASESLRVLDPRPSPLADPGTAAAQAAQTAAKTATPAKTPDTPDAVPTEEAKPQDTEAVTHNVTPTKTFNKDSLANRLRPVASSDLPEAPAVVIATNTTPGSLNGLAQSPLSAPGAPPAPRGGATKSAATSAVSGGQIIPAEVQYKKAPEYPKMAKASGAAGIVEVEATIGVDGRVKNVHASKGNPMLQKAATDAVMEWRYKPALLNGKPVESPVVIRLNFVPDHQVP